MLFFQEWHPQICDLPDKFLLEKELQNTGADTRGVKIMSAKGRIFTVKLKNVRKEIALIIKQKMLSLGGDAAVSKGILNGTKESTDILILGTEQQLESLAEYLKIQPFNLEGLSESIKTVLSNYQRESIEPIIWDGFVLNLNEKRTFIMGILNITPDSFYDGNRYFSDIGLAISRAEEMIEEGADIIDIGGESTRPGSSPVDAKEEIRRVIPVIRALAKKIKVPISIDTYKPEVAKVALEEGASIVNDITALSFDPENKMAELVAERKVPIVLMHMQGTPQTMQLNPQYTDLIYEIIDYLKKAIERALKAGIEKEKIIVDPGIGFGKTVEHNITIIKRLNELKGLGRPILLGVSRKSFIGKILNLPPAERLEGTAAAVTAAILNGAKIIRVHDVKAMKRVAMIADAIKYTHFA